MAPPGAAPLSAGLDRLDVVRLRALATEQMLCRQVEVLLERGQPKRAAALVDAFRVFPL